MPFKSKAQQKLFFTKEERGELPKGTAERWAKHTPNIKKLPEKVEGGEEKTAAAMSALTYVAMLRKQAYMPADKTQPFVPGMSPTEHYREANASPFERSLTSTPWDIPSAKGKQQGLRSMLVHPALRSDAATHVDASRAMKTPLSNTYMDLAAKQGYESQLEKTRADNPITNAISSSPLLTTLGGAGIGAGLGAAIAGRKRRLLGALLGGLGGGALSYGLSAYLKSRMGGLEAPASTGLEQLQKRNPALTDNAGALSLAPADVGAKVEPNMPRDLEKNPYPRK